MVLGVGRIVQYVLSAEDAERVNRRRVKNAGHREGWPDGAQAHVGNGASEGDVVPLIVVRVWPDEYGPGVPAINGQALLDGNDQLWITSAREGDAPGTWRSPQITA